MHYMVSMALAAVVAAVSLQHLSRLVCRLLAISALPLVNGKRWFELSNVRCRRNFIHRAGEMMRQQLDRSPRSPFRVLADVGEVLILPPEYAHEIRNNNQLSFTKAAFKARHQPHRAPVAGKHVRVAEALTDGTGRDGTHRSGSTPTSLGSRVSEKAQPRATS